MDDALQDSGTRDLFGARSGLLFVMMSSQRVLDVMQCTAHRDSNDSCEYRWIVLEYCIGMASTTIANSYLVREAHENFKKLKGLSMKTC
jgi:hypothetical protein